MPPGVLTKTDYQALMQNPGFYLTDPEIKRYQVEKDPYGIPRVRSGGFALTYKLYSNGRNLALRCFHRVSPRREQHYSAISSFLSSNSSSILVSTSYQPKGIKYQGGLYPITIMDWIEGDILGTYVFNHSKNRFSMSELVGKFQNLVNELNRLKIAHGDLSHSNIMLTNGRMILIDYDGMYVPGLTGNESVELGNKSFQHPGRTLEDFGPDLDNFSEIVIYLALKAISISPSLYDTFGTGREGLLFAQSDFLEPNSSALINEIEKIPDLTYQIRNFKQICQSDFSNVPRLEEFVRNSSANLSLPKTTTSWKISDHDFALDATNVPELFEKETENVIVIGKISAYKRGTTSTYRQDPYLFLNVGFWPNQSFTVVIWSETLAQLENAGLSELDFENSWVSVSGVLSIYNEKPQIVLESPANIAIITSVSASERLNRKNRSLKTSKSVISSPVNQNPSWSKPMKTFSNDPPNIPEQQDKNEVLNRLYGSSGIYGNQSNSSLPNDKRQNQAPIPAKVEKPKFDVSKITVGMPVEHKSFGIGEVIELSSDVITVIFGQGKKSFEFPNAFENGFLKA